MPAWVAHLFLWGPGLCCSWPDFPDRLQLALTLKPSDTYTFGPKKTFPVSAPTFEDFKRLEGGGMGQKGIGKTHYGGEWSSFESETSSGANLGYSPS